MKCARRRDRDRGRAGRGRRGRALPFDLRSKQRTVAFHATCFGEQRRRRQTAARSTQHITYNRSPGWIPYPNAHGALPLPGGPWALSCWLRLSSAGSPKFNVLVSMRFSPKFPGSFCLLCVGASQCCLIHMALALTPAASRKHLDCIAGVQKGNQLFLKF